MVRRRSSRLVYGLLAASVALNLAGAGFFAATWGRPGKPPRTVDNTIAFVSERYPDGVRQAIQARLEARRDELGRALDEMKSTRRASRDAMSAEPLDPARVAAALATARDKGEAFQSVIHAAILEALPAASAAGRAEIGKASAD
jgi:uncharacterized membrane protein